jgi:hypothetical protein
MSRCNKRREGKMKLNTLATIKKVERRVNYTSLYSEFCS